MSQNPKFEFPEEELESSIDAFRYTSTPRTQVDRHRTGRRARGTQGNANPATGNPISQETPQGEANAG